MQFIVQYVRMAPEKKFFAALKTRRIECLSAGAVATAVRDLLGSSPTPPGTEAIRAIAGDGTEVFLMTPNDPDWRS